MEKSSKYSFRDLIPFIVNRINELLKTFLSSCCSRLLAEWWNVEMGHGCDFCGLPYFRKHPTGKIIIGRNCTFRSSEWSNSIGLNHRCFIEAGAGAKIIIGDKSGFSGTIISAASSISIGQNVLCGGNCVIIDNDRHSLDGYDRLHGKPGKTEPVLIGDNVFLGMNVTVLKGVRIGYGTVVAADSVVSNSLPDEVLAGGNPAKIIRPVK